MARYEMNQQLVDALDDFAQKIERRVLAQQALERAQSAPHSVREGAVAAAEQALSTAGAAIHATSLELSDTILDLAGVDA